MLGPLYFLPLAWLWFRLIEQLRIGWSLNPQYAYGWAVPFLCLYLIWRKAESREQKVERGGAGEKPKAETLKCGNAEIRTSFSFSAFQLFSFFLLCFLYAPIRLVLEANPGWSLATWPLALITIGLTLLTIHLVSGQRAEGGGQGAEGGGQKAEGGSQKSEARSQRSEIRGPFQLSAFSISPFVFPICFFLVAVPWPFVIEQPVIQGLTRLNTALTVEILGLLGIPAMPRGNVIELATGSVGIDEACSGIRSLQATLMIALFLGELHHLSVPRRLVCVFGGFALAMVCNLVRTLLLCWVAAHRGVEAIAGWHDPAGVTILVACFLGIWGVAWRLKRKAEILKTEMLKSEAVGHEVESGKQFQRVESGKQKAEIGEQRAEAGFQLFSFSAFQHFSILLVAWLLLVELGVAGWYRHLEANLPAQATWHIAWPATNAVCQDIPIGHTATEMLRYDQARQVQWIEADGTRWQLSWFYWKPGQAAAYLAKTHNPLICMPAAGFQVVSVSPVEFVDVGGLRMPVRVYQFAEGGNSIYVLYSRWEDQAVEQSFGREGVTRFNRLRSVWNGRGNQGQRVISLALWTGENAQGAREQLIRQLQNLLVVNPLR